jgi:DNA segregation ATPase FtsK/SpoIIIE-like protein
VLSPDTILQERYRVLRLLGRGGMGTVYEALDERLSRRVALKETRVETDELRRAFAREAKLLANLQHTALPRVIDHFNEGAGQYIIMEFIAGEDLGKTLAGRNQPFSSKEVLRWADQLLDALQYLHAHEPPVVHRDIKPSNLKVTAKGGIILLDFGLAKGTAGEMPKPVESLSVSGYTPHYASLEQIQGERTSSQSDLYSLAATLYNLLTKQTPVDALKRATAVINGELDPLIPINKIISDLPDYVVSTLMRALSLQPARRPESAALMRAELSGIRPVSPPLVLDPSTESTGVSGQGDEMTKMPLPLWNKSPQQVKPLKDEARAPALTTDTLTRVSAPAASAANGYKLPNVELLNAPTEDTSQSDEELLDRATRLAEMFAALKVKGQIVHIRPGPVLTTYEFKPEPGIKYSRVVNLTDDICLAMRAPYAIVERVPGTSNIGIQIPNQHRETIHLRYIIESKNFIESASKLTIAFGETVDGAYYIVDLARLPHLLIGGATGAGKSVFLNTLIVSILYKAHPDEVKFIMVDPKRVELGLYQDIPHLATPIITDPSRAGLALKWAVMEMERRYKEIAAWGVRNVEDFNSEVVRRNLAKDYDERGEPWKPLPYIIIIIDELADLMQASPEEIEEALTTLARKERAVGIHLVLATQRPSSDVITGPIKANFPARISFHVSSKLDSRVIIDENGAEHLLGLGDMLFLPPRQPLVRVHGAYVDEAEIARVVAFVKAQGEPVYDPAAAYTEEELFALDDSYQRDELFEDALRICVETKRASASILQRRLRIGYGRAAVILDQMEREGLIGQADGARPRPVLGRAYELVAQWEEGEKGNAAGREVNSEYRPESFDTPANDRLSTAAERVADFMRDTDPARNALHGKADPSANNAPSSPKHENKRKRGWWSSLFGDDKE